MAQRADASRLDSVIRIAEDAEKKAYAELARCRDEIQGQEQKLDELIEYRKEYHQEVRLPGVTLSVQQIKNRFCFLQKLEQAIQGQRNQIDARGEQEIRLRKIWIAKRVRRRALNKASEQRRALRQQTQKREEQKQMDDLVRPH
mgnify:CR=1 FL=1